MTPDLHGLTSATALALVAVLVTSGCSITEQAAPDPFDVEDLRYADRRLLEVAMVDAFSPPVASRVYVYPHLAHYQALRLFAPDSLPSLDGVLKDWTELDGIDTTEANGELVALLAFCRVARKMVFAEQDMDSLALHFIDKGRIAGLSEKVLVASSRCADAVAGHMARWIDSDRYIQTRTMDRFTSTKLPGHWIETPPDHTAALEPHWGLMRTLVLDSASAVAVEPPPPYDPRPDHDFRRMVMDVYTTSLELSDAQRAAALYWDDNPNISDHRGHLITMQHKVSPPGHWLNIISTHTRAKDVDLYRTTQAYTLSAIAMYDGLVACWHHKFSTDLLRPITYIQEHLDPAWYPLIQTPPFPEFPSGHAVVSSAAATVLEALLGPDTAFSDSTEVLFGMGVRRYPSFTAAADEVGLSRFYAGIHFMPAVREGQRLGRSVGDLVLARSTRGMRMPSSRSL